MNPFKKHSIVRLTDRYRDSVKLYDERDPILLDNYFLVLDEIEGMKGYLILVGDHTGRTYFEIESHNLEWN